jgi:hypothetical protein
MYLHDVPSKRLRNGVMVAQALYRCECGREKVLLKSNAGHGTRSCGCIGHGMAKLTEEQVREIKGLLKKRTMPQIEIANIYDVSQTCISSIKRGDAWAWVTE